MIKEELRIVRLLFDNDNILRQKRRREVIIEIRLKYLKEGFHIPSECFETPYTNLQTAIEKYCDYYDTDEIKTTIDYDIALNNKNLKEYQDKFPEYFV